MVLTLCLENYQLLRNFTQGLRNRVLVNKPSDGIEGGEFPERQRIKNLFRIASDNVAMCHLWNSNSRFDFFLNGCL